MRLKVSDNGEASIMSFDLTMDDFAAAYHRAAAEAYALSSSVSKGVTHSILSRDFAKLEKILKTILDAYEHIGHNELPGLRVQRLEADAADFVGLLEAILAVARVGGLDKHPRTKAGYFSLSAKLEQFKDYWVAFNASTDADLLETLKANRAEETVPLDFLSL